MSTDGTSLSLDSFVANLLEEKGLGGIDPEIKEQVTKDLLERVEDRVNAGLLAHLPPEKASAFEQVLDAGDEARIQDFISTSIPNADEVVAEALMTFRQTYVNG